MIAAILMSLALSATDGSEFCQRLENTGWAEACSGALQLHDTRAPCLWREGAACALRRVVAVGDLALCDEISASAQPNERYRCRLLGLARSDPQQCRALTSPWCSGSECPTTVATSCAAVARRDLGACQSIKDAQQRSDCLGLAARAVGGARGCELLDIAGGKDASPDCLTEVRVQAALAALVKRWPEPCTDLPCLAERKLALEQINYPPAPAREVTLTDATHAGDPIGLAAALAKLPADETRDAEIAAAFALARDDQSAKLLVQAIAPASSAVILRTILLDAINAANADAARRAVALGAPWRDSIEFWLEIVAHAYVGDQEPLQIAPWIAAGVPEAQLLDKLRSIDLPWDGDQPSTSLRMRLKLSGDHKTASFDGVALDPERLHGTMRVTQGCSLAQIYGGVRVAMRDAAGSWRIEQRLVLRSVEPAGKYSEEVQFTDQAPQVQAWRVLPIEGGAFTIPEDPQAAVDGASAPYPSERQWRLSHKEAGSWHEAGTLVIEYPLNLNCD